MTRALPLVQPDRAACCDPMTAGVMDAEAAERFAHAFRALSDPARVRLVSIIAANPGQEACVCDLIEPLGLSQPTVSHHLKILTDSGLLTREQRGRWAYYRLVPGRLNTLADALHAQ